MARLYIVATPIGNLGDISFRAIDTLKEVDLILCEDTRMTKRLLDRYEIEKPLLSYHQRSKLTKTEKIIEHLEGGKNLALVTDAGTPGVSDPGNELVGKILEHFNQETLPSPPFPREGTSTTPEVSQVEIVPIPGASAVTTLVSVAGMNMSKFVFLGFPPNKKGRETFFKKVLSACHPALYYDSPYRFLKNLELLKSLDVEKSANLIVGRELTKLHEEVVRGNAGEILEYYSENSDKVKGEFAVIVWQKKKK